MKVLGLRRQLHPFFLLPFPHRLLVIAAKSSTGREEWEAMERVRQGPRSLGEALWCGGWGDQHSRFPAVVTS